MIQNIAIIDHVGCKAGMDYYSGSLAKGFSKLGVKTYLFSNFIIDDDSIFNYPFFIGHTDSTLKKATNHVWAYFKTIQELKKQKIRYVIVHVFSYTYKDYWALKQLHKNGFKIIAIVHDIESFGSKGSLNYKEAIYNEFSSAIVVHNQYSKTSILDKVAAHIQSKIAIIPHGNFNTQASKNLIHQQVAKKQLGLALESNYLLFFGQIKQEKGLDVLLNALALLPESYKLIIAGKPWKNDFEAYQSIIEQHQLQNRIIAKIKFIDDEERTLLFQAADLIILPYREIYQSGVLLLSMSFKLPALVSDLPAMKEIINDEENGYVFKAGDSKDLANKIEYVFGKDANQKAMVTKNAWEYVTTHHNWNDIAQSFCKLIQQELEIK